MANWVFQTIHYVKFLLRSTNKHGVHSPFVFDLVTNCFNRKDGLKKSQLPKDEQLAKKIISYFKDTSYTIVKDNSQKLNEIEFHLKQLENDSYIMIMNPYRSKESLFLWNQLINLKIVSVSIDTFYLGLLFVRTEQQKQHFVIRL